MWPIQPIINEDGPKHVLENSKNLFKRICAEVHGAQVDISKRWEDPIKPSWSDLLELCIEPIPF